MRSHHSTVTRFATRHNARVAYDPGVPDAIQPGVPLVLLHDLLADRTVWNPLRAILADRRRVIVPDARGHGTSPTLTNRWYTVGELAADLLAILDAERVPSAHLVGHGLGAATAFELALRHPPRVASLTLIAPALPSVLDGHPDPSVRAARLALRTSDRAAADAAYKGLVDKALDTYFLPRVGAGWRRSLTGPQLGAIRRHAGSLSALLPALDAYTVDSAALPDLCPRVLIVNGAESSSVPSLTGRWLADRLPRAQSVDLGLNEEGAHAELAQRLAAFVESDAG